MNSNKRIEDCYKIEDDNQALSCIKGVIREVDAGETCKPRIVLLVQENCGGCAEEKAKYKNDIDSGVIQLVDIYSDDGRDIAKRNNIEAVPAVLILDCKNTLIE